MHSKPQRPPSWQQFFNLSVSEFFRLIARVQQFLTSICFTSSIVALNTLHGLDIRSCFGPSRAWRITSSPCWRIVPATRIHLALRDPHSVKNSRLREQEHRRYQKLRVITKKWSHCFYEGTVPLIKFTNFSFFKYPSCSAFQKSHLSERFLSWQIIFHGRLRASLVFENPSLRTPHHPGSPHGLLKLPPSNLQFATERSEPLSQWNNEYVIFSRTSIFKVRGQLSLNSSFINLLLVWCP